MFVFTKLLKKAKIVSSEHIANGKGHRDIYFLDDYDEADEEELRWLFQEAKWNNENSSAEKKQILLLLAVSDITTTVAPFVHFCWFLKNLLVLIYSNAFEIMWLPLRINGVWQYHEFNEHYNEEVYK